MHLKSKHKIDHLEVSSTSSASTSASMSDSSALVNLSNSARKRKITDNFSKEKNTAEKKVSRMVSKDIFPFRDFWSSPDLRELFKAGDYNLAISANSIKSMVSNYGTYGLLKLKDKSYRFTLTFDEWTSTRNRRDINVNINAFAQNKPIFWNLGLVRIYESLLAEDYITILNNKLSEYDRYL